MKKFLLTVICAMTALFGMAQNERTYNEKYVVAVGESADAGNFSAPKDGVITLTENADGTVNFLFKDFVFDLVTYEMPVGNLEVKNVSLIKFQDGLDYFGEEGTFEGGTLDGISYEIGGKLNDVKLYCGIEITMDEGQAIFVLIGSDDFSQPTPRGKVYTEPLVVTANGEPSEPVLIDVTVIDNGDGTINFELKNFTFVMEGNEVGVGNIVLEDLRTVRGEDGLKHFSYNGPLVITEGDKEDVPMWMGPMLGELPLVLQGKMNSNKLYVTIDIDMQESIMQQMVNVQVGTDDFPTVRSKVYTDKLIVTIDGESSEPQDANVKVEDNGDGTVNIELTNFILGGGTFAIPVGNIRVENLYTVVGEDGLKHISFVGPITIQPGDVEGVEEWYGPQFGPIPVALEGKMDDNKLFVNIDINFMSQIVNVQFGTDDSPVADVTTYKELLLINVNGTVTNPQVTDIDVIDNGDGTINFALKNFILEQDGMKVGVGNIALEKLTTELGEDGMKHFSFDGNLAITAGDPQVSDMWIGPDLGEIPVVLRGKLNDEQLYVTIDVNMGMEVRIFLCPARIYTDQLVVSINEQPLEPQRTDVTVADNEDGSINFLLKNFTLDQEGTKLGVGNIFIQNLPTTMGEDGLKHFSYSGTLAITSGDPEISEIWAGPEFGEIPLTLRGKMNNDKLYVTIDINIGMVVFAQFGTDDFNVGTTGDTNGDGIVDGVDAQFILNIMAIESYDEKADVNKDGFVDGVDYQQVLNIMSVQ